MFNQFLWLFDDEVSDHALDKLRANLAEGLLSRRVEAPTIPTARHRWVASTVSLPLERSASAVPSDAVRCWAEQRVNGDLDPEAGIGWQLAAAPLADGGTIVSLVCSHMIADGAAMVEAVVQANSDVERVGADRLGARPSVVGGLLDDLGDTAGQLAPIARWIAGSVVDTASSLISGDRKAGSSRVSDVPRRRDVGSTSGPWSPPYVVVECSASEWHAAACEWGGTSNSLFIGIMTAVSELLGRATPGDEVRWSLPFNDRTSHDLDSNSTKIIPLRVPVSDRQDLDLARIRKASKAAFTEFAARQASGSAPTGIPLPLIQMLPDVVVAKLPVPADGAEGLCSNLGPLPEAFGVIGGVPARSVAARATFAGADADFARQLGGGSTAWATEIDGAVTITVHGMDPDRMATDEQVQSAVAEVLDRWSIGYRFW